MSQSQTTRSLTGDTWLDEEIARCAADPVRFHRVILGRPPFWHRQVEVCRSIQNFKTTVVVTGNAVGKSFLAATLLLWFPCSHPNSKTVVAAPTQAQLSGVVWSEMTDAYASAAANGFPLGGKLRPLNYELGPNWRVEGYGTGSVESKSGRHAGDLLAVIEEASGVPPAVLDAINSLNPSRRLYIGNPLNPQGEFYERAELSGDDPTVNVIRIPSLESPHIHMDRSPVGMADKGFLEDNRHKYGEDSIWWLSHVLAKFPNEISEGLLPIHWLNLAGDTIHIADGKRWISVDIGEGNGGDPSVILCRDANGVCRDEQGPGFAISNQWKLGALAAEVRKMSERFNVPPTRIIYDRGGPGTDFDNRLRQEGLNGAIGYRGNDSGGGPDYFNLRAACHWRFRQRLDPKRPVKGFEGKRPIWVPQVPFSIPPEILSAYRAEFHGIKYKQVGDQIVLEEKDEFKKRLKGSPNVLDAFAMSFAYPYR